MKTPVSKSILTVVMMALTSAILISCDLLDKADDVDFDATLEETIAVSEQDEGNLVEYSEVVTLDATSESDINKYKNKIKGFTVKKVSYQITSFTGVPGSTFNGTLSFGDASQSTATVVTTINNLNLQAALVSGQLFDLPISQTDVDKVATMLKDDKAVKLYLDGTLSSTPLVCSVRVVLDVTVKADAL